jgi:hypothetical protein
VLFWEDVDYPCCNGCHVISINNFERLPFTPIIILATEETVFLPLKTSRLFCQVILILEYKDSFINITSHRTLPFHVFNLCHYQFVSTRNILQLILQTADSRLLSLINHSKWKTTCSLLALLY